MGKPTERWRELQGDEGGGRCQNGGHHWCVDSWLVGRDKKNNGMKSDGENQCRTKGSVRPIKFCSREPGGNFFRGELDVSVSFSKRISEPQREKIGNFNGESHVYPKRI